jgi:catechol 2,3-dioxygenase-like lactoylglutathione lyase family enzyme
MKILQICIDYNFVGNERGVYQRVQTQRFSPTLMFAHLRIQGEGPSPLQHYGTTELLLLQYPMLLNHAGIINKSEEEAVRFYKEFLCLEITKEWVVPAELSEQIFEVPRDIKMFVFERKGARVEVFIFPEYKTSSPVINHFGLLLNNFSEIIGKAPQAGIELITGKTKDKTVHFIKDYSGNLIEIKQM